MDEGTREGLDRDDLVRMILAIAREDDLLSRHIRTALAVLANTDRRATSSRFLANATGIDRRDTQRALDDLVDWKLLELEVGEGSRGSRYTFKDPAAWAVVREIRPPPILNLVADGNRPQAADPLPPQTAQTAIAPARTPADGGPPQTPKLGLVADGGPHKVIAGALAPERKSKSLSPELEELEAVNRKLATYPNPRTGRPKTVRRLDSRRLNSITKEHLGGDRSRLPRLLEAAIDGYVCRNGITVQESGFDGWAHFELESLLRPAHLDQNLAATLEAWAIGNRPPFKRGAHSEKRSSNKPKPAAPRGPLAKDLDPLLADLKRRGDEYAKLSPEAKLERRRAEILEAGEDSQFRRDRVARVDQELAVLRAGGS